MQIKHFIISYNKIKPKVSLNQKKKGKLSNSDTSTTSIFKAHEEAISFCF